jgi:universal stress protein A
VTVRSILCPIDFSEQSRQALRWAGEFAARFQSRLTVLSVVDPLLAEAARVRLGLDLAKTETEPALREFVAATWPDGPAVPAPPLFKTGIGDPAAVIQETAASEGVQLIVMGTQGLGGFRQWLLGSTTKRLLRSTHLPVLVVPPASDESGVSRPEAGRLGIARILAATDFSESSIAAVKWAVQVADQFSAVLALVHAVEPLTVQPQWQALVEESHQTLVAEGRARLRGLVEQVCGSRECEAIVSVGRAADVIASIAADRRADLIVMGLASEQGAFAPSPGSIAYRVLTSTTVPVLVAPAASKATEIIN